MGYRHHSADLHYLKIWRLNVFAKHTALLATTDVILDILSRCHPDIADSLRLQTPSAHKTPQVSRVKAVQISGFRERNEKRTIILALWTSSFIHYNGKLLLQAEYEISALQSSVLAAPLAFCYTERRKWGLRSSVRWAVIPGVHNLVNAGLVADAINIHHSGVSSTR